MRKSLCCLAVVALIVLVAPLEAAVAPAKRGPEDVRNQLSAYFADIARNSPTVLGKLSESPETMKAIQKRIASMSGEELARMESLMAQAPDWKAAPEALAHAFPPEVLAQMRQVGSDYAARVPRGEEMRDDVRTLVAVLKVLPDAKLKEMGVTREMVVSLDTTFGEMTPLQSAMLHRQAGPSAPWEAKSTAAIQQIPPALHRGAMALAEHGPLTETDLAELNAFRAEMIDLLARIEKLPPHLRQNLDVDAFRMQVQQLRQAAPDAIFMVRHNLSPEMLKGLSDNVALVERLANLSDAEKKALESFRGDLASTFKEFGASEGEGASVDELLGTLGPEHLLVLRHALGSMGDWQTALPALYRTLGAPELQTRLASLEGNSPDPVSVQSLEAFREQMLVEVDQAKGLPDVDAAFAERARKGIEAASLQRLEIMRLAVENLPPDANVMAKMGIGVMSTDFNFNCAIDMPSPVPDISLDFICNPIEDALQAVKDGITSTVNSIVSSVRSALESTINTVSSALTSAINAVSSTVNSIISSISSLANQIWSFLQTVPNLAMNAIKSALDLLLDIEIRNGVTLRHLVASGAQTAIDSMKTLVGLADGWWNAVASFTLPAIPCPPTGFHTPFGDVGARAASDNYGRYRLVIDGIIDMIPDTEISLAVKIPAQVVYMMFDFLGECLDQAAGAADTAELTTRHNLVMSSFSSLSTYIGGQVGGLSSANTAAANGLTALVNQESGEINATMLGASAAIQSSIEGHSDAIQNAIDTESTEIQTLIANESDALRSDVADFRALNLRLIAERVLKAGVGNEIVSLELLQPFGYLEVVRDTVLATIDGMTAGGYSVGLARRYYDSAVRLMVQGLEKDAFREFSKAYREATK